MMILGSARRNAIAKVRKERSLIVADAAISAFKTIEQNRFLNDESAALYDAVLALIETIGKTS